MPHVCSHVSSTRLLSGSYRGCQDEGSVRWTPRLPSAEEEEALRKQRDFNRMIEEQGL